MNLHLIDSLMILNSVKECVLSFFDSKQDISNLNLNSVLVVVTPQGSDMRLVWQRSNVSRSLLSLASLLVGERESRVRKSFLAST